MPFHNMYNLVQSNKAVPFVIFFIASAPGFMSASILSPFNSAAVEQIGGVFIEGIITIEIVQVVEVH